MSALPAVLFPSMVAHNDRAQTPYIASSHRTLTGEAVLFAILCVIQLATYWPLTAGEIITMTAKGIVIRKSLGPIRFTRTLLWREITGPYAAPYIPGSPNAPIGVKDKYGFETRIGGGLSKAGQLKVLAAISEVKQLKPPS